MRTTDAWVLHAGSGGDGGARPAGEVLSRETFALGDPRDGEVLVEPLYGSWEANLDHALARSPIDVCRARGEDSVVIGNLGVVRVLRPGSSPGARRLREGDVCMVMPFGKCDRHGYAELVYAYDMPGTVGLLAKRTRIDAEILLPVPEGSAHSLPQWAAYARYFTAWDNWRTALRCWQAQLPDADPAEHLVFGWGGGVTFAELLLARRAGFRVAMTASTDERLAMLREHGITPVDRRLFPHLARPAEPAGDMSRHRVSEKEFLRIIGELSGGAGAAVFIDNIGAPLYRATLKALARQGVLTTCGWKQGMSTTTLRAAECIRRHLHVHTHVWRLQDSAEIRDLQEETGWIADIDPAAVYPFDEVPRLADDYAAGRLSTYFPLFQINPV
ncbi:zinc-binding alcohol dehydrogenase family protein [Actinomadura spongiicola]|uniref:Zinc-binding alcohol dehydrogenase family protein n=1 Tax=Actinomadura spongiicola TaxID=2303421 RepID=A0A372GML0_9ACTN|nr:zinc-binding dehydrogenase [Actinomadura spongiicola]RFS86627.1 zinc-binding alcohol dehydrogenase family protein [Actinomadura spongiicola]